MYVSLASPTTPAAARAEVKAWLRLSGTAEDALVDRLILSAQRRLERHCRRTLTTRTVTLTLDPGEHRSPVWLPYGPVASITSLTVYDDDDASTVVSSSNYRLTADGYLEEVGSGWTQDAGRTKADFVLVYSAGYGNAPDDVPEDLRDGLLLLIADMHEFRQGLSRERIDDSGRNWQDAVADYVVGDLTTWYP